MTSDQKQAIKRARRRLKEAEEKYDPTDGGKSAAALAAAYNALDRARFFYYRPRGEHD